MLPTTQQLSNIVQEAAAFPLIPPQVLLVQKVVARIV